MGIRNSHPQKHDDQLQRIYDDEFEKRLALQNIVDTQNRALELAARKERVAWEILAGATTCVVLIAASSIYRRREYSIPIVPIILGIGYRYDSTFGEAQKSIRDRAEEIYQKESTRLQLPGGPITLRELDEYILQKR